MALTKENRETVKNFIWNTLMAEDERLFNTTQLRMLVKENLNIELSPQAIGTIMTYNVPDKYQLIRNDYYNHVRYGITKIRNYTLKKEKGQVFFADDETDVKNLVYDYNAPDEDYDRPSRLFREYDFVAINGSTFKARAAARFVREAPEWIFSYPDLLFSFIRHYNGYYLDKLPRTILPREMEIRNKIAEAVSDYSGYLLIDTFNDAHRLITDKSFDINIFNSLSKSQLSFMMWYDLDKRFGGFKNALAIISIIDKFCLIQIKNYENIRYDYMVDTLNEMYDLNWLNNINTNHSFKTNEETFKAYKDREKNRILAERLQKLNFLNGLEINDEYVIVVPQTIEDLVVEGYKQNNCVGHYYNGSIIRGENYIYFIRNKSNVRKSYITCRFNNSEHATVEYRHKNNEYRDHRELISAIDAIINENLKGE